MNEALKDSIESNAGLERKTSSVPKEKAVADSTSDVPVAKSTDGEAPDAPIDNREQITKDSLSEPPPASLPSDKKSDENVVESKNDEPDISTKDLSNTKETPISTRQGKEISGKNGSEKDEDSKRKAKETINKPKSGENGSDENEDSKPKAKESVNKPKRSARKRKSRAEDVDDTSSDDNGQDKHSMTKKIRRKSAVSGSARKGQPKVDDREDESMNGGSDDDEDSIPDKTKGRRSNNKRTRTSARTTKRAKAKSGVGSYYEDDSSSSAESSGSDESCHPEIVKRGQFLPDLIEFSVDPIQHLFICSLCKGFYREPHTLTKQCLHTFCKSCLVLNMAFQEEDLEGKDPLHAHGFWCPECQDYLGSDWRKHALPDRALQHLMDKVMFRDMAAQDEEDERIFYTNRGIKKKPDKMNEAQASSTKKALTNEEARNSGTGTKGGQVAPMETPRLAKMEHIRLIPAARPQKRSAARSSKAASPALANEPATTPALDKPYLQVPCNIRVGQLKKYLAVKLPSASLFGEIFCNGAALGNEWTVEFVKRTMWMPGDEDEDEMLTLQFR